MTTGRSDIFTPMPDDQIGRLALIEAMRANTDALQRVGRQVEGQDGKLDEMNKHLGQIDTRLALLENNNLSREHDALQREHDALQVRVSSLEVDRERLRGERGIVSAVFNSKGLAWLVAAVVAAAAWAKGVFS